MGTDRDSAFELATVLADEPVSYKVFVGEARFFGIVDGLVKIERDRVEAIAVATAAKTAKKGGS